MEWSSSSSHGGASWADQWDYNSDPSFGSDKKRVSTSSPNSNKYKEKFGDGLEKTKNVVSRGVRKIKQGTNFGIQCLKEKYHKTTRKH